MYDPETFGFTMEDSRGPVTKYTKETETGRVVVYEMDGLSVKVTERANRDSKMVVATSGFFWREDIGTGSLLDTDTFPTTHDAHAAAENAISEAL